MKEIFRQRAIELRQSGLSYSEILKNVPVAKSTLSLWLRSVNLSKRQVQRLTQKKLASAKRGGLKKKEQRLLLTKKITDLACSEIKEIKNSELLLMGAMLYWAEGSKEKDYKPGTGIRFSNSDPLIIKIMLKWFRECLDIEDSRIKFNIYIHQNYINELKRVREYWADITGFPIDEFGKIYFKKHSIKTVRKNIGNGYNGQIIIRIANSSNTYRRILGWIDGICLQCRVV